MAGKREGRSLLVYASMETHTWIQKAADLSGLGTDAIRWIPADAQQRMAEMVNFTKLQILQQAGTSMLAQANTSPQSVLKLLG